jgi:transposase
VIIGIDAHKFRHAAALLDARGGVVATINVKNTAEGVHRLRAWITSHDAGSAVIGVENAGGYASLFCAALAAAGHEVLNVPAWRVHRDRLKEGPGKSDSDDAVAIALVVLRKRDKLGPALEPELVRSLQLLDTHRRASLSRRSDAIQRLRHVWSQVDPEAEASVASIARQKTIARLRRIRFGSGLVEQAAARVIHELAGEIALLSRRVAELDAEIARLLEPYGEPFPELIGAGPATTATLIAQAGDARRFRSDAAFARYGGAAPIPASSGTNQRHRLHRGGNRQINAALHRIALTQAKWSPEARTFLDRKLAEGKTPREARRALKRHLSDVVYHHLCRWADRALPPPDLT